jgi:hypothetical protein
MGTRMKPQTCQRAKKSGATDEDVRVVRHRLTKSRSRLSCYPNNLCASNPASAARRGIADRGRIKVRKPVCFKRSKHSDREPEICGARVEWCQDRARLTSRRCGMKPETEPIFSHRSNR